MKRSAEIVNVGGIATDIILRTSSLPTAGRCVIARELSRGLGGKGANQAVAAARLLEIGSAMVAVEAGNDGNLFMSRTDEVSSAARGRPGRRDRRR